MRSLLKRFLSWVFRDVAGTAIHPDYKKLIQYAFTIDKVDYYQFKDLHDMPSKRWSDLMEFIDDAHRKIDNEELIEILKESLKEIEKGNVDGLTNAVIIHKSMIQRLQVAMNVDLYMRVISCAFFTKDEDLTTYDHVLGDEKIEKFTEYGLKSFFFLQPIKMYWPSMNITEEDFQILLNQREAMRQYYKELKEAGILSGK